jgi:hypothetical protein
MRNSIFTILLLAVLAVSCSQGKKAEQFKALPFPDIAPPAMMTDPQNIAEYLAEHYWDRFIDPSRTYPSDSVMVSGVKKGDIEQKFADWAYILDMISFQKAEKALSGLYSKALACEQADTASVVFEFFNETAYKYFYDPNSPLRNEDYYNVYVRKLAEYAGLTPEMRGKHEFDVRMTSLNRVGTVAADFKFADKYGRFHTLHGIKAPLTLLFFSNPGCNACMDIINVLKGEPAIASMISDGTLAVLNIYIDEDLQGWRDYMPIYPQEWYNGFDPDLVIRTDNLYNVRAIPSLYLLDEEKRVILKDAPENRLFDLLLSGQM